MTRWVCLYEIFASMSPICSSCPGILPTKNRDGFKGYHPRRNLRFYIRSDLEVSF